MTTVTLEAIGVEVGLSPRMVHRYIRALGIRPCAVQSGRNHYAEDSVGKVRQANLDARARRADAVRASIAHRRAEAKATPHPTVITVKQAKARGGVR